MKAFLDRDFLLFTDTAKRLYHETAADLSIIDYHCHLSPREIFEDRRFENITQVWLGGDHYKWRLLRAMGVEEQYITGDAPDREKFQKWAEVLSVAIGNPLYHWSHLELKNYFGYEGVLNGGTAEEVWQLSGKKLAEPGFSARNLIRSSRVKALCTTDDPADSLVWHRKLRESDFEVKVLPAFRPDRALGVEKADFPEYLGLLGKAAGVSIDSLASLQKVLALRIDFFHSMGCRLSDHGMEAVPYAAADREELEGIFARRLAGESLSMEEIRKFKTGLLLFLGREYAGHGWVFQLHFGVIRNNSVRLFRKLGADTGLDSIGGQADLTELAAFLNALDETDELPKTILYSLNPNDNAAIDSILGCFQDGAAGKLQHGSAWWFNDHEEGIRAHLSGLASGGMLAGFVGMLTDSRSFLSYARHEYFRRILCDLIGGWVESGRYPNDEKALRQIVEGVCYKNAERYFGLE